MVTRRMPRAYSYRADPAVPDFPDDKPIIVFDGHCALCSGWARFVIRYDPHGRFRLLPAQTPLGTALYQHYGLDSVHYDTNLLIEDGRLRTKLDGSIRMAAILGWPWTLAGLLRVLPTSLQNALYGLVARNRFRLFGRNDVCYRPNPKEADRFLG